MSSTTTCIQAMSTANRVTLSQLPPELLVTILSKLNPSELMPTRAVSRLWCDSVHVVFGQVNTLILADNENVLYTESYFDVIYSRAAAGTAQLLVPKPLRGKEKDNYMIYQYFDLLGHLFPRVTQLMIGAHFNCASMVKLYECAIKLHWIDQLKAFSVSIYMLDIESFDWFHDTLLDSMFSSGVTRLELKGIPFEGWRPEPTLFLELEQLNLTFENPHHVTLRHCNFGTDGLLANTTPIIGPKCRRLRFDGQSKTRLFSWWCEMQSLHHQCLLQEQSDQTTITAPPLAGITHLHLNMENCFIGNNWHEMFHSLVVLKLDYLVLDMDTGNDHLAKLPSLAELSVLNMVLLYDELKQQPNNIPALKSVRDLHLTLVSFLSPPLVGSGEPVKCFAESPIGPSNPYRPVPVDRFDLVGVVFVPFFPRLRRLICHDRVVFEGLDSFQELMSMMMETPSAAKPRAISSTFDSEMSVEIERQLAIQYPKPPPVLIHEVLSIAHY